MLERISFQLANNRGRYTHFIHNDGTVASLYPLEDLHEARVALMSEKEFPSEAQYDAAEELASYAVGINPHIIVTFDEGTSPFPARYPPDHPANALLVTK
jgi:hypothetical protein